MKLKRLFIIQLVLCFCILGHTAFGQTTEFTYQGNLKDGANPANGNYDFEFTLFDALSAGTQIGATLPRSNVLATNGAFSVKLDFGSQFPGADRFLEIRVRPNGAGAFTPLAPRQPLMSTPYAVRSLNSATADSLSSTGSGNFIQNSTSQQTASFNISGDGTAGGMLAGNIVSAGTEFQIGGARVLWSNLASNNTFVGIGAGVSNTTGDQNTFVGRGTGPGNLTGNNNTFVGAAAGNASKGSNNTAVGRFAGLSITTGSNNTLLGANSNVSSPTLSYATAIGSDAVVGTDNTIVIGRSGGQDTVQIPGALNVNIFDAATQYNLGGSRLISNGGEMQSLFIGLESGAKTTGISDTFVGFRAGQMNTLGNTNAFFGAYAGRFNTEGNGNTFIGNGAGVSNIKGTNNTFIGLSAGFNSGNVNDTSFTAHRNTFVGTNSGFGNESGAQNTFVGFGSNPINPGGINNTGIGSYITASNGVINSTMIGAYSSATQSNSLILGSISGVNNCTAANNCNSVNVGIGTTAPAAKLYVRDSDNLDTADIGQFFANNLTQGIGIGFNRIEAVGSNPDQHILIMPRGLGNVGIGTSSPASKLHVFGNGILRINADSDSNAGLGLKLGNAPKWSVATVAPGNFQIYNDAIGQNAFWIDRTTNNVGIGTVDPVTYRLDVATSEGGIRVTSTHPGIPVAEFVSNGPFLFGTSTSAPGGKFRIIDRQSGPITNPGIVEINNPPTSGLMTNPDTKLIVNGTIKAVIPIFQPFTSVSVCWDLISQILIQCAPIPFKEQQTQIEALEKANALQKEQIEKQQERIKQLTLLMCSLKPDADVCK